MDSLLRDIMIGAIGSVLGALLVFVGTYGIRFTKESKKKAKLGREKEVERWKTNKMGIRQGITNAYLFDILKYLLFGNLFLAIPTLFAVFDISSNFGFVLYRYIMTIGAALALASYFLGVGRTIKYLKLRALDD